MSSVFEKLYVSRCHKVDRNGQSVYVPHFWKPEPLKEYPLTYFNDVRFPVTDVETGIIKRIIALGVKLEIEVGELINEVTKRVLPFQDASLKLLLKSNAADESRHYQGFVYAKDIYGMDTEDLAPIIEAWLDMGDKEHPVAVAALMETSLFLVTLGFMRLFGSPSLTRLALKVAEDEFRHVQINSALAKHMGYWKYSDLTKDTLEWLFKGQKVKLPNNHDIDLDKAIQYSTELFNDLHSPELDKLTNIPQFNAPFELSNSYNYTSRELQTV